MSYPHPISAREGWPFVAGSIAAATVVHVWAGFWWALPLWLIALFILQFFRDPPRMVPEGEGLVLSPADGRVIAPMRFLRKLHKWLGLIVGIQLLLWTISGLIFAWLDHHEVMAEHSTHAPEASVLSADTIVTATAAAITSNPGQLTLRDTRQTLPM